MKLSLRKSCLVCAEYKSNQSCQGQFNELGVVQYPKARCPDVPTLKEKDLHREEKETRNTP
jgi:hypothetical protein